MEDKKKCGCGKSGNLPYCDGSHRVKDDIQMTVLKPEEERKDLTYEHGNISLTLADKDLTQWKPCRCDCHLDTDIINTHICCDNGWVKIGDLNDPDREQDLSDVKLRAEIKKIPGWEPVYEGWYAGMLRYRKEDGHTFYVRPHKQNKLYVSQYIPSKPDVIWSLSMKSTVFDGYCKDIEEFKYICKLLKIE